MTYEKCMVTMISAEYCQTLIDTPLGPMIAIGDQKALVLLEFVDCRGLEREILLLRKKNRANIISGESWALTSIRKELELYFAGKLWKFQTPISLGGTPFQQSVWQELQKIAPGKTSAYADLARAVGRPTACRAVAAANGANQLAIIIPCHRVIHLDGTIGGYAGGVMRKKWLLKHETID